jgi:hypothetical protein
MSEDAARQPAAAESSEDEVASVVASVDGKTEPLGLQEMRWTNNPSSCFQLAEGIESGVDVPVSELQQVHEPQG